MEGDYIFEDGFFIKEPEEQRNNIYEGNLTLNNLAEMYLFLGQSWQYMVKRAMLADNFSFEGFYEALIKAVDKYGKSTQALKLAKFTLKIEEIVETEQLKIVHQLCIDKHSEKGKQLLEVLLKERIEDTGLKSKEDEFLEWRERYHEFRLKYQLREIYHLDIKDVAATIKRKDGRVAPEYLVLVALIPYLKQCRRNAVSTTNMANGFLQPVGCEVRNVTVDLQPVKMEQKIKGLDVRIVQEADQAAKMLDRDTLIETIRNHMIPGHVWGIAWMLPYMRYGGENEVKDVISRITQWKSKYVVGSSGFNIVVARSAMLLNETRLAILTCEKTGWLEPYAQIRNISTETLLDEMLCEFGLDEKGEKVYNLGKKQIKIHLCDDFTLELFDMETNSGKKTILKRGADLKLYEQAQADFMDLKKNIKKVVKMRNSQLFEDFLSGVEKSGEYWMHLYQKNPVLNRIARRIVWSQGKKTFIVTEDGERDSQGKPYLVDSSEKIKIAHPMEMRKEEVELWQRHFNTHRLKQPFRQIWEPVISAIDISKHRYKGCMIPYSRLRNRWKDGIMAKYNDVFGENRITFADCETVVRQIDRDRYSMRKEDCFDIEEFKFEKYTRKVNHIVGYLDQVTIVERIIKDNSDISQVLSEFTFVQIMEFIDVAIEHKSNNALAVLMDYKNQHFADYDANVMDEFWLD